MNTHPETSKPAASPGRDSTDRLLTSAVVILFYVLVFISINYFLGGPA